MKALIIATLAMCMLSSCEIDPIDLNLDTSWSGGGGMNWCRIVDADNNPVEGATVEIYSSANQAACATVITDENGVCHIRKDLGTARLEVSKAGFQSTGIENPGLDPESALTITLQQ